MGNPDAFVDLGEDFGAPVEVETPPWRPHWRRFRLPVLLVLLLLFCAASVEPPPSLLRVVARTPVADDASVMIADSELFVLDLTHGVRAYDLADGRLRWSTQTIELATETTMTYDDGNVIVSMDDTDASGEHTVALDAATGRKMWTSDFGSAQQVADGVLVQAMPRPAGYNYPGTPQSGSVRLIDARTGATRWTHDVDVNCAMQVATEIVELCPNTSKLTVIGLVDGLPIVSRTVELGDAAVNFLLPQQDQIDVPQLFVAGNTILIAHAHSPKPVLDAYELSNLSPLWGGVSIAYGQHFEQCGTAVCLTDGPSAGDAYDLATGRPVSSLVYVPAPTGSRYVFIPVGFNALDQTTIPMPSADAGLSVGLPDSEPRLAESSLLARAVDDIVTLIQIVPGVGPDSCATVAGYLVCTTIDHQLTAWKVG